MRVVQDLPYTQATPAAPSITTADALDFTHSLIVNRAQLEQAYTKARFAARRLSSVENLSELDFEAIDDLCRCLYQATTTLAEMLDPKGEFAQ